MSSDAPRRPSNLVFLPETSDILPRPFDDESHPSLNAGPLDSLDEHASTPLSSSSQQPPSLESPSTSALSSRVLRTPRASAGLDRLPSLGTPRPSRLSSSTALSSVIVQRSNHSISQRGILPEPSERGGTSLQTNLGTSDPSDGPATSPPPLSSSIEGLAAPPAVQLIHSPRSSPSPSSPFGDAARRVAFRIEPGGGLGSSVPIPEAFRSLPEKASAAAVAAGMQMDGGDESAAAVDGGVLRRWPERGYLCCGRCGLTGCSVFWLACCCPFWPAARNSHKLLGTSFRRDLFLFALLFFGFNFFYHYIVELACPSARYVPSELHLRDHVRTAATPCERLRTSELFLLPVMTVGLLLGALRRRRMRHALQIRGSLCSDLCCWVCCPTCALAQETRVVWQMQRTALKPTGQLPPDPPFPCWFTLRPGARFPIRIKFTPSTKRFARFLWLKVSYPPRWLFLRLRAGYTRFTASPSAPAPAASTTQHDLESGPLVGLSGPPRQRAVLTQFLNQLFLKRSRSVAKALDLGRFSGKSATSDDDSSKTSDGRELSGPLDPLPEGEGETVLLLDGPGAQSDALETPVPMGGPMPARKPGVGAGERMSGGVDASARPRLTIAVDALSGPSFTRGGGGGGDTIRLLQDPDAPSSAAPGALHSTVQHRRAASRLPADLSNLTSPAGPAFAPEDFARALYGAGLPPIPTSARRADTPSAAHSLGGGGGATGWNTGRPSGSVAFATSGGGQESASSTTINFLGTLNLGGSGGASGGAGQGQGSTAQTPSAVRHERLGSAASLLDLFSSNAKRTGTGKTPTAAGGHARNLSSIPLLSAVFPEPKKD